MERSVERDALSFEAGQRHILERAAGGAPLRDLLEDITRLIERHGRVMLFAALLRWRRTVSPEGDRTSVANGRDRREILKRSRPQVRGHSPSYGSPDQPAHRPRPGR
jgi:hypothetical protein